MINVLSFYPNSRSLFSFSKKIKNKKKSQRGGVSKGISDSVFETVWRHHSRQWLSKWPALAKFPLKRRMKISNFSRIYFSDFLNLTMIRSLLSLKTIVWALFSNGTSRGVMHFKDFFLSSSKPSKQSYRRSHFWGPVDIKIQEFRHSNRRFIKRHTRIQPSELSSALQSQWIPISIPSKFTSLTSNYVNAHKQTT